MAVWQVIQAATFTYGDDHELGKYITLDGAWVNLPAAYEWIEGGHFFFTIHRDCIRNSYALMFWLKNNTSYSLTGISTETSTICDTIGCWTTLQHAPKCLAEFSSPLNTPSPSWTNTSVPDVHTNDHKTNLGFFVSFLSVHTLICRYSLSNSDPQAERFLPHPKDNLQEIQPLQTSPRSIHEKSSAGLGLGWGPDPVTCYTQSPNTDCRDVFLPCSHQLLPALMSSVDCGCRSTVTHIGLSFFHRVPGQHRSTSCRLNQAAERESYKWEFTSQFRATFLRIWKLESGV